MMFSPSRDQARDLFFATWSKYRSGEPLQGLEATAVEVILLHPEYHAMLDQRERYIDRDFRPEAGELNPFLHLSLHLSIAEQLGINHPPGIAEVYRELCTVLGEAHDALHVLVECLGETVWHASRSGLPPDSNAYLECLRRQLEKCR